MVLETLKIIELGLEYYVLEKVPPQMGKSPKIIELEFIWWPEAESNCRHEDFQSSALPTELSGHKRPLLDA